MDPAISKIRNVNPKHKATFAYHEAIVGDKAR